MRGAEPFALNEHRRVRPQALDLLRDSLLVRSDDHGQRRASPFWRGPQHMRQQQPCIAARAVHARQRQRLRGFVQGQESAASNSASRSAWSWATRASTISPYSSPETMRARL
jgi:hypothetical protein